VAQVTIYVPDDVARRLRRDARRARKSVSAYIVDLIQQRERHGDWPSDFARLFGSCDLPAVDDEPPEETPPL
jgi:predicted CopG family antitoxin